MNIPSFILGSTFCYSLIFIHWFLERGKGRKREKHLFVVLPTHAFTCCFLCAPTRDQTHKLGVLKGCCNQLNYQGKKLLSWLPWMRVNMPFQHIFFWDCCHSHKPFAETHLLEPRSPNGLFSNASLITIALWWVLWDQTMPHNSGSHSTQCCFSYLAGKDSFLTSHPTFPSLCSPPGARPSPHTVVSAYLPHLVWACLVCWDSFSRVFWSLCLHRGRHLAHRHLETRWGAPEYWGPGWQQEQEGLRLLSQTSKPCGEKGNTLSS